MTTTKNPQLDRKDRQGNHVTWGVNALHPSAIFPGDQVRLHDHLYLTVQEVGLSKSGKTYTLRGVDEVGAAREKSVRATASVSAWVFPER